MIELAAPGTIVKAAVTREVQYIWSRLRNPRLGTQGSAEISYRVCHSFRNSTELELMPPHFNKIELTDQGLRDLPTFNFTLAILTSPQFYHVLLVSQAIHYSSVCTRITVSAWPDKAPVNGFLEISGGTPMSPSQGWRGKLYSPRGERLGSREGGQFEYSNWELIGKFRRLAEPFED